MPADMPATAETVTLSVAEGVGLVTLNRPPVNAVNGAMRHRLVEIFDEINDRDDVRAAVLTGQGRVFCAGADLKDRPDPAKPGAFWAHNRITRETGNCIRECAKPVVAAVNGAALGAGFGLMAACDIMFAAEGAMFGMPEIDVGLAGGVAMLTALLGRSRVRRMVMTGMRVSAEELYRQGVIEAALPPDRLLPEAMAVAAEIASKAPLGIRYAKNSCNMAELMPERDTYRFEQNFTYELAKTEDSKEARAAFAEKRKPVFKGR